MANDCDHPARASDLIVNGKTLIEGLVCIALFCILGSNHWADLWSLGKTPAQASHGRGIKINKQEYKRKIQFYGQCKEENFGKEV